MSLVVQLNMNANAALQAATISTSTIMPNYTTSTRDSTRFSEEIENFITALYVIVGLFSIVLNSIICYMLLKKIVPNSSFNIQLLNLSITDIASVILITPYIFIDLRTVSGSQNTLNYLCGITIGLSLYFIASFVTIFILSFISIVRYFAINHPYRFQWIRKKTTFLIAVAACWIYSVCYGLPNIFTFRYDKSTDICYRDWPRHLNGPGYVLLLIVLSMVLPIIIMLYTFFATVRTLWFKQEELITESAVLRSRKGVVTLLGVLMVAYFVCWTPNSIYWALAFGTSYFPEGEKGEFQRAKVIRLVTLISLCNTVCDPIIYAFWAQEFRAAFLKLFLSKINGKLKVINTVHPNTAVKSHTVEQCQNQVHEDIFSDSKEVIIL